MSRSVTSTCAEIKMETHTVTGKLQPPNMASLAFFSFKLGGYIGLVWFLSRSSYNEF
jgi:hypothetical protein